MDYPGNEPAHDEKIGIKLIELTNKLGAQNC
jgi:hypothetical protein